MDSGKKNSRVLGVDSFSGLLETLVLKNSSHFSKSSLHILSNNIDVFSSEATLLFFFIVFFGVKVEGDELLLGILGSEADSIFTIFQSIKVPFAFSLVYTGVDDFISWRIDHCVDFLFVEAGNNIITIEIAIFFDEFECTELLILFKLDSHTESD